MNLAFGPFAKKNIQKKEDIARDTALVLFRTLSVRPFSYPFGSEGKVREALGMSVMPLLGEGGSIAVIPLFTEKGKSSSSGCAFVVAGEELAGAESSLADGTRIWPAPLAFMSEVDGNGLVICIKDGIQGMLFKNSVPVLSYWMEEGDMEEWFRRYAQDASLQIERVFTADLTSMDQGDAERACAASVAAQPGLDSLTLSLGASKRQAGADAFMMSAMPFLKTAVISGAIFSLFALGLFVQGCVLKGKFESLPGTVYLKAFGETSSSPVRTALKKAAALPEEGPAATLEGTLGSLSYAFRKAGGKLKIESFRYGKDASEVQGSADSAASAEKFRSALADRGFTARMSDIRQIPSAGMRFTIALERKAAR